MDSGSLDDTLFPELRDSQQERVGRRVAELFDNDAQFRAAAPIPEVIEAACTPGLRLTQVLEAIVEGYADRPALGQRARELVTDAGTGRTSVRLLPRFDTISYREFWAGCVLLRAPGVTTLLILRRSGTWSRPSDSPARTTWSSTWCAPTSDW